MKRIEWTKDFEDALQYFSAVNANADFMITRNLKDFNFACSIEIMEPRVFLIKCFPQEIHEADT
jgi:hypothetical protein